jgi:16S rRNA A1518/A1519 N6-dimethyltransferase RsmA/KsgA/DIM1 with predicted DNA glycosylase/AP lyase activity
MPILLDPEQNETHALLSLFNDFAGKSVLEIGCGDGRLTWRYADRAGNVIAIEPDAGKYAAALKGHPNELGHVLFLNLGLEPFAARNKEKFDIAILAWSL